jgi:hypothetical protein
LADPTTRVDLDELGLQLDAAVVTLLEYSTEYDSAVQGLAAPVGAQAAANTLAEGTAALLVELRAHREREASGGWLEKAYPGYRPPAAETRLVVAPSGFIDGVYAGQLMGEGWRIVRYVVAPPAVKEPT